MQKLSSFRQQFGAVNLLIQNYLNASCMHPIKKYQIEFTLLFLAVTLGFFAENYREYSVERNLAALLGQLNKEAAALMHEIEVELNHLN